MKLNPFTGTYLENPATTWRELLDDSEAGGERVRYAEDLDLWLIFRHSDVRRALGDHEAFKNYLTLAPVYQVCPRAIEALSKLDAPATTAAADAPVHPRTRRALRTAFATTAVRTEERYGAIVRRRTEALADRLVARLAAGAGTASAAGAGADLVPEFTAELPVLVILDILGVPEADVPRIKAWSDGQIALIWGNPDEEEQVRLASALVEFWQYCRRLTADAIAGRRDTDGTDFISRALTYRGDDDRVLTEDEVASLAFNLLVAGHETTSGLLSHCFETALSTPGLWRDIAEGRADVAAFVEETMRLRPAIDGWLRVTAQPVTFGDVTIPAGSRCLLLLGAANRDPAVFDAPERFDPGRADVGEHLSFGYGPHFCIGASLARLEAEVALTRLATRLPGLRLADGYLTTYRPNVGFRGHVTLPVVA